MKAKHAVFSVLILAFAGCSNPKSKQDSNSEEKTDGIEMNTKNNEDNSSVTSNEPIIKKYSKDFIQENVKSYNENVLKNKSKLKPVKDKNILNHVKTSNEDSHVYLYSTHAKKESYQAITVMVCEEYMDNPFDIVKMFCMTFDNNNKYIDQFPLMIYKKYPVGDLKEKSYGKFTAPSTYRYTEEITGEDVDGNNYTTKTITEYSIGENGRINKKELPSEKGMENAKIVEVSNISEFLKAINSNTIIKLKKGQYDLSKGMNKNIQSNHFEYVDAFNNGEFVIYNVDNFKIIGAGSKRNDNHIFTHPDNGATITFRSCNNIYLENLKIGHQPEASECQGGVLVFETADEVSIEKCDIYGCGRDGITATETKHLSCTNSHIYSCSANLMQLSGVSDLTFDQCQFSKTLGGIYIEKSNNMEFKYCTFEQNQGSDLFQAINIKKLTVRESKITGNIIQNIFSLNDHNSISIYNNEIKNNQVDIICNEEGLVEDSKNTIEGNDPLENGD
jgi:hypothetical protein